MVIQRRQLPSRLVRHIFKFFHPNQPSANPSMKNLILMSFKLTFRAIINRQISTFLIPFLIPRLKRNILATFKHLFTSLPIQILIFHCFLFPPRSFYINLCFFKKYRLRRARLLFKFQN